MTRFWVAPDNVVVREWTKDEYDHHNPEICIKEDVLCNVCMNCGKYFSTTSRTKEGMGGDNTLRRFCRECKKKADNRVFFRPKNRNNGYAYLTMKLKCMETGYKNVNEKTVAYTQMY